MTTTPTPQQVFDDKARTIEAEPERIDGITATYRFDVVGEGGGTWTLVVDEGRARISREADDQPDVTVQVTADDLVRLGTGELRGTEAYMTGRLKVRGKPDLAIRLADILG